MFTSADITYNKFIAKRLRELNFDIYCPNENETINDKNRDDITAEKIYAEDIRELESSNIFLCIISEDSGTMWEAGYMDCLSRNDRNRQHVGVIGLATDIRLQTLPRSDKMGVDNQAFYINGFVVGGLKNSLGIFTNEDQVFDALLKTREKYEKDMHNNELTDE